MAEIWGTKRADVLVGTDENDVIRGGRGEDQIYGGLGDDTLYGGWGNDFILDDDGRSEIYGGRGGDNIHFARGHAYGGLGNDLIEVSGGGWAIGGDGNDTVNGRGALWGDQGPGVPLEQQTAGNDRLGLSADADGVWAHGGLGNDTFKVLLDAINPSVAVIDDFRPGEDKITVIAEEGHDEPTDSTSVFLGLDADHNSVINAADALAGAHVWVDQTSNTMFMAYGTGFLTVRGTTQIAASDYVFT